MRTQNITIIGQGVWGKALMHVLSQNTGTVSFWDTQTLVIDSDMVVLAIPTQALREVLQKVKFSKQDVVIINTSKGIEKASHKLPFQIVQELLPGTISYGSLIGPSFAQEVSSDMPTLVNIGIDQGINPADLDVFQTPAFHIRIVKGFEALELAGAFKNIYAIACGMADGLGFGMNTRIQLMMLAIDEFYDLCHVLGYIVSKDAMPGTIGDLLLSCSSTESRNYTLGKLLVEYPLEECLRRINSTVEGIETVQSVSHFTTISKLPLAQLVQESLRPNGSDSKALFKTFITSSR